MENNLDFEYAYQQMREHYERQCRKHELADDAREYADNEINQLSNVDLMELLILHGKS